MTVRENENATLPCKIPAGKSAFIIVWRYGNKNFYQNYNGKKYKYSDRKKQYTVIGGASIFLYGADRHDHGKYTCMMHLTDGKQLKKEVNLVVKCKYYIA